jgi:hypothetical protein
MRVARTAAATGTAALRPRVALPSDVCDGGAQQANHPLAAARLARRDFTRPHEVFLFYLAIVAEEFVEGHGNEIGL